MRKIMILQLLNPTVIPHYHTFIDFDMDFNWSDKSKRRATERRYLKEMSAGPDQSQSEHVPKSMNIYHKKWKKWLFFAAFGSLWSIIMNSSLDLGLDGDTRIFLRLKDFCWEINSNHYCLLWLETIWFYRPMTYCLMNYSNILLIQLLFKRLFWCSRENIKNVLLII